MAENKEGNIVLFFYIIIIWKLTTAIHSFEKRGVCFSFLSILANRMIGFMLYNKKKVKVIVLDDPDGLIFVLYKTIQPQWFITQFRLMASTKAIVKASPAFDSLYRLHEPVSFKSLGMHVKMKWHLDVTMSWVTSLTSEYNI